MNERRKNTALEETLGKLEKGVEDLFTSARYADYLRTMGKFYRYSFNNTVLIAMQNPTATHVASYSAWKRKFHRYVNKGESGIKIIAPMKIIEDREIEKIDPLTSSAIIGKDGNPETEKVQVIVPRFRVATVFDVSQTSGRELPTLGVTQLEGEVQDFDNFIEALKNISPVPIMEEELKGTASGYYDDAAKKIGIRKDMSQRQTMKTTVHEIAHALMHSPDVNKDAKSMTVNSKEVQAESVAFTVCDHFGLPTDEYSFGYIAGWSKERKMDELRESMDAIRKTAGEIIEGVEENLRELELGQRRYEVWQLKDPESVVFGNKDYSEALKADRLVHISSYEKVIEARLEENDTLQSIFDSCSSEALPEGFAGTQMKASDVIAIKDNGDVSYSYVNGDGFQNVPDFAEEFTALGIASNIDELMHSYDPYGYTDMIDDRQENVLAVEDQILRGDTLDIREWLNDVKTDDDSPQYSHPASMISQKLDIYEKQYGLEHEAQVSYYVAECMEFPVAGEYYETNDIEMARKLYDSIPAGRMNAIKGIGATVSDSNGRRDIPLVKGSSYQKELIDSCDDVRNNAILKDAAVTLEKYFKKPVQEKTASTIRKKGEMTL